MRLHGKAIGRAVARDRWLGQGLLIGRLADNGTKVADNRGPGRQHGEMVLNDPSVIPEQP